MTMTQRSYLGLGLYSYTEAARLLKIRRANIMRWAEGNSAVIRHDYPELLDYQLLTFTELIELKMIAHFRDSKMSLQKIRKAAQAIGRMIDSPHPFAIRGIHIFCRKFIARIQEKQGGYEEFYTLLPNLQLALPFIEEMFEHNLDYSEDNFADRYWPMGRGGQVVIDPKRSFGSPILEHYGVPTYPLYQTYLAGDSPKLIGRWYDIPLEAVLAAIRYEESLREPRAA